MALNNLASQNIQDTYKKVVQTEGNTFADGSGSALQIITADQTGSMSVATASYAISASHEITYELSSSYAETASFIANDVHALTSTEVNQLKTIGSNTIDNSQWNYVSRMQAVSPLDTPQFTSLELNSLPPGAPTIQLPPDANSGSLHLKVRDLSGQAPGIYLGSSGDSVLYGVNEFGLDVWDIDQLGKFNGTVDGGTF
jgi:hypothetical protein